VDTATLEPLVRSIAAHGVLQPLLVRGRTGRLDVISSARRLAAAARAGLVGSSRDGAAGRRGAMCA
jgi:ParB-like chromosome segregation protein Spo0J